MANEPLKTAVVTDIGKAKLDAAYQAGEKVIISQMALGNSNLAYVVPDPAFTELVNEFGRQDINEGNTTDSWINALVYVDSQQFAGESILEFGLYDDEGDLIVYSSYTPSVVPAVGQDYIQLEIECSVDLYNASAVTIEVTPIYPQATELERGIAKVATEADVTAGIDDEKIVTSKKLAGNAATNEEIDSESTASKHIKLPQLWRAFSQKLFSGFAADFSYSGYIKFPNFLGGFILQWVVGEADEYGRFSHPFPIAFPNSIITGIASERFSTGWAPDYPTATIWGFSQNESSNITAAANVRWVDNGGVVRKAGASGLIIAWGH
ncbi:phage tail protein [Vibrio fluvialis]|nr:phage tail protein [Vibrio fluvialis]